MAGNPHPVSARAMGRPDLLVWAERISAALLLLVMLAWSIHWARQNGRYFLDPDAQTGDVRTVLFPLHRYADPPLLTDDPIARQMSFLTPPAMQGVYVLLVRTVGLFWLAKVVQILCWSIVLVAAVALARMRRGGLAAGVVLLFILMRHGYVVDRIAGGLPRSFGFPLMALWLVGALGRRWKLRWSAVLLAALTWPSAMALLLGMEGVLTLSGRVLARRGRALRRLATYGLLVLLSGVAVAPFMIASRHLGRTHTLAEAAAMPVFGPEGRMKELPLPDPVPAFALSFISPLQPDGVPLCPALAGSYRRYGNGSALAALALVLAIPLFGLAPLPRTGLTIFLGAVGVYLITVLFAFRFYTPQYAYLFAMPLAATALLVNSVGLGWHRLRPRPLRQALRNVSALALILVLWTIVGDGLEPNRGMTIDRRDEAPLYQFVLTLPPDVRIAQHPHVGVGIPFWTGRATLENFETLQPWLVEPWRKSEARTFDTLAALYATDRQVVLDFCQRQGVTHLLLHRAQYQGDLLTRARVCAPFDDWLDEHLRGLAANDLVLAGVPASALVFDHRPWLVVEVRRLHQAWAGGSP